MMPSYGATPVMRDDYRCLICRQKDAFHCEHDTPYRDRFLDDKGRERRQSNNDTGPKPNPSNQRAQQNLTTNTKTATSNPAGARQATTRTQQPTAVANRNTPTNQKPNDPKKTKSCVIL